MKKIRRKRIKFFKNRRLGWDVLTISPSRGFFFCLKKLKNGRFAWDVLTILQTDTVVESIVAFQKRTYRVRRPHEFRCRLCPKMKNILFFFCGKQAFRLRRPHNFAFSPEFFLGKKKQKSKSENSPLAWDVLTISLPVPRSDPWKNDKFRIFLRGKTGVWRETSTQFRVISGACFFLTKKKSKTKKCDLPETSSQFRGLLRAQINEKN